MGNFRKSCAVSKVYTLFVFGFVVIGEVIFVSNASIALDYNTGVVGFHDNSGVCGYGSFNSRNCSCDNHTIVCVANIPRVVPRNITTVIIKKYNGTDLSGNIFSDKSWTGVFAFDLNCLGNIFLRDFEGLHNLEDLTIDTPNCVYLYNTSFSGLGKLRKLTITGMNRIDSFDDVFTTYMSIPYLEEITINPGLQLKKPTIILSRNTWNSFHKMPLKIINFSNVNIVTVQDMSLVLDISYKLDILKISGSTVTVFECPLCEADQLSNSVHVLYRGQLERASLNLDISGSELCRSSERNQNPFRSNVLFLILKNIYANRVSIIEPNYSDNINLTGIPLKLSTVSLKNNSLVSLNFTWTLDENNPIVSIDLSYNKIQYIAKTVLWCLKNLKMLYLSWNKLFKMQHDPEFKQLFMNLTNLQYLDLAHNGISYLHNDMFELNKNLDVLLLNNNEFTSLAVDLRGLHSLQTLDLGNNKIKYFTDFEVHKLSAYFESRVSNKTTYFQFILQGNPLQCVCKSKEFLKMILYNAKVIYNTDSEPLTCSYQGKEITINKEALDKADYLCKRVKIIVSSTIATTVTCVVIGILVVVWWRRRKRRQKQDLLGWFVREFLNGNLRETHLAFIAMSGNEDDMGLMQTVVSKCHALAKQCLNTHKKLILTGYDFTPGFPIVSEAYKMIKASCVVIAFVSKSFCQSKYCMMELQEACKQDKPLILVFTEHIDETLMTPYMHEVFERYARGRLEQTQDGEWVISPSMDKLCEAMIVIASEQYKHDFT